MTGPLSCLCSHVPLATMTGESRGLCCQSVRSLLSPRGTAEIVCLLSASLSPRLCEGISIPDSSSISERSLGSPVARTIFLRGLVAPDIQQRKVPYHPHVTQESVPQISKCYNRKCRILQCPNAAGMQPPEKIPLKLDFPENCLGSQQHLLLVMCGITPKLH